ncbi:MAG TPA: hypothetical protein VF701_07855 [Thermoanaerobaculia bacterium]
MIAGAIPRQFRHPFRTAPLLVILLVCSLPDSAGAAEIRLEGAELAGLIESAFSGTSIRLHSSSPPAQDSFIRLPPGLGGEMLKFNIPVTSIRLGIGGSARYAIEDINSLRTPAADTIDVRAEAGNFIITIHFEDEGTEIRGHATGRLASLRQRAVPDLEIKDIAIRLFLTPRTKESSGIAFAPVRVLFLGEVEATGSRISMFGRSIDLLDQITGYKTTVKEAIEREVTRILNHNLDVVAATIEAEIVRRLAGSGFVVSSMEFKGTALTLKGRITWR